MSDQYTEYLVLTSCGRRFAWSALDLDQLYRDLFRGGYNPLLIRPMNEVEGPLQVELDGNNEPLNLDPQALVDAEAEHVQAIEERKVS